MSSESFQARLAEARAQILSLPAAQQPALLNLLKETGFRHEQMKDSFAKIHEALAEWQLMLKYLIFDREATVRERDELRRRLNEGNA